MKNPLKPFLTRRIVSYVLAGGIIIAFYLILQNWPAVWGVVGSFFGVLSPFLTGALLAYLLNMLMRPIERYVFGWVKRPKPRRLLSALLAILLFVAVFAMLLYLLLPQLVEGIGLLARSLQQYLSQTDSVMDDIVAWTGISSELIESLFGSWNSILDSAVSWATDVALPSMLDFSIRLGSGLVSFLIALFTSIYMLIDKERLTRQCKLIARSFTSEGRYNQLMYAARRANSIFSRYVGGTLVDSMIVGLVCFLGLALMGIPYAGLIATLVGVTNVIPTFGPIIGSVPSALILLMTNKPINALYFLIFIIVLQQLDANILLPKIVGNVTGLSSLWVLFALWVCGAVFGFMGLLLGVPIAAVLYFFAGERVRRALLQKGYDTDGNEIDPDNPPPNKDVVRLGE